MLGGQGQLLAGGQGFRHRLRPIVEGGEVAVLVQPDFPAFQHKERHSQLLTLSKRVASSTKPG